jgi:hypothetical protein
MVEIVEILQQAGPILSSDLSAEIQKKLGLRPEASRKRIERAKTAGKIKAIEKLKFRRNEQFLYLPQHAGTTQLIQALKLGLAKAESPLYDAIMAIQARGGMILQSSFPILSGLPIMGKKPFWAIDAQKLLLDYQLIVQKPNSLGACFQLNKEIFAQPSETRRIAARLRAEQLCIQALLDWLRLQGMVTAEKATIRGQGTPQFGHFAWDLVSPSYAHALTKRVEDRLLNGFVVADVCLGKTLTVSDVQYFFNKVISACSPNNRPFISFLVGQFFEKEALLLGRKLGIMITTPTNLFGTDFGRILEEVIELLDSPEWQSEQHAIEILQLMDRIAHYTHMEGLMANVLADTFEMFVAHCNTAAWGKPMFGRKFADAKGIEYDSDILFKIQGKGTLGIECKKKNRNSWVTEAEVKHWFETVVPLIRIENQKDRYFKDAPCEFSMWTNSIFHTDALDRLNKLQKSHANSFLVTWKNGQEMKEALRKTQDKKLLDVYKQHFDK